MKFRCSCDAMILDQTDYLPSKAHLIADQDVFDALDASRAGSDQWFLSLCRRLYECASCGRLWIENSSRELRSFTPDSREPHFLASIKGDAWESPLRGRWTDHPTLSGSARGQLYWSEGAVERTRAFQDWEALEAEYHAVLEALRTTGRLRDASLSRNGDPIHSWPPVPGGGS